MKILALERELPGTASTDFAPYLQAEARAVWDMLQAGTLRGIHFRDDRLAAVLILEAESTPQAEATLDQLSLVKAGLIEFEVIGLRPYPGFERLLAE
ncbi:MAG: superoxide dismutase [Chloroflexota bacterium]